jgi:hypothetical protein
LQAALTALRLSCEHTLLKYSFPFRSALLVQHSEIHQSILILLAFGICIFAVAPAKYWGNATIRRRIQEQYRRPRRNYGSSRNLKIFGLSSS